MPDDHDCQHLLEGLTPSQHAAVVSEAAPLCILASAGAGKTRVLTRRIAYRIATGSASTRHTLALTFTRKAAGEMQSRLGRLGLREQVAAGTFHSLASAQLQRWWADRRQTPPTLLERKGRLLAPLAASRPGLERVPVGDLASHIEWAKARLIAPQALESRLEAAGRRLPGGASPAALAGLYARYENEKERRGLIDFDDLLARCAEAIEADPAFAGAQRWRWRHVYVDEFQDLNPLQHRLLLAWLGTASDLCVVGDSNQAIYGWNGADPSLLADVPHRWPATVVIRLDANHRSTEQIVRAAASVLGSEGAHLCSAGREGPVPVTRSHPSETVEATAIAAEIHSAHDQGRPWRSMAVLTRTNAQLVVLQKALAATGVPCWSPSQSALFDDPVARQVLAGLRTKPSAPVQVAIADLQEMADEAASRSPAGGPRSPAELSNDSALSDDSAGAVLSALIDLARAYIAQEPTGTVGQWLAWMPSFVRDGSEGSRSGDRVTLSSFHRAKGLEWAAVWVAGLEDGLVPIGGPSSDHDEERRLLYVALTRASDVLTCSWARQRTFGTRPVPREPSPWLEAVEAATAAAGAAEGMAGDPGSGSVEMWRSRLADQRRGLRQAAQRHRRELRRLPEGWPEPDADLADAIRAWRTEAARASGVPAYVILHDSTVEALASLRPRSLDELLAVPGLGPVKADRYGPSLLSMVAREARSA